MTEVEIEGLGCVLLEEISESLLEDIQQKTWFLNDFQVKGVYLVGSRIQKRHRVGSDLDVVVLYEGSIKDDRLHDILNSEPLWIDGIQIDFISTYGSIFEPINRPFIPCIMENQRL